MYLITICCFRSPLPDAAPTTFDMRRAEVCYYDAQKAAHQLWETSLVGASFHNFFCSVFFFFFLFFSPCTLLLGDDVTIGRAGMSSQSRAKMHEEEFLLWLHVSFLTILCHFSNFWIYCMRLFFPLTYVLRGFYTVTAVTLNLMGWDSGVKKMTTSCSTASSSRVK